MLVSTPSIRHSDSARSALATASANVAALAAHDDLGQQRVVARLGAVAGVAVAVDAHAGPDGSS